MDKILDIVVAWFVLFVMSYLLILGLYLIYGVSVSTVERVSLHHIFSSYGTILTLVLLVGSLLGAMVLVLGKG